MKIDFAKGQWDPKEFDRITSLRTDCRVDFMQEEEGVVNDDRSLPKGSGEYHYISILHKEPLTSPVTLETVCEFDEYGAPLLVLTDDLVQTEDGFPAYGHHFEIVAFEEGFNIWELNGTDKPFKAAIGRYSVPCKEKVTLTATIDVEKDTIIVTMCGETIKCHVEHLPHTFRAGITACEGINRFYTFEVK